MEVPFKLAVSANAVNRTISNGERGGSRSQNAVAQALGVNRIKDSSDDTSRSNVNITRAERSAEVKVQQVLNGLNIEKGVLVRLTNSRMHL